MEKELIHEVENKLVEIVGRSNVYVKASPIPEFDWMLYILLSFDTQIYLVFYHIISPK